MDSPNEHRWTADRRAAMLSLSLTCVVVHCHAHSTTLSSVALTQSHSHLSLSTSGALVHLHVEIRTQGVYTDGAELWDNVESAIRLQLEQMDPVQDGQLVHATANCVGSGVSSLICGNPQIEIVVSNHQRDSKGGIPGYRRGQLRCRFAGTRDWSRQRLGGCTVESVHARRSSGVASGVTAAGARLASGAE